MNRPSPRIAPLGLLAIGYSLQLFSPLRTNTDATCFLQMGASASDGLGFVCCENARHYPVGYPAVLMLLDRGGIACSASLIGLNLIALVAGLIASGSILRRSFGWTTPAVLLMAMATLLNWAMIKHVTIPLTDLPYFGLSMLCLVFLADASGRAYPDKLPSLSAGLILLVAAIAVRTVGIALVPAFAFALLSPTWGLARWAGVIRENRRAAAGLVLAIGGAGLAGIFIVTRSNYFREMLEQRVDPVDLALWRLDDWGELVLNISMAKAPGWVHALQLIAGGSAAFLLLLGFAKRPRIQVVDVYMAGYLTILLAWPYRDARFWIPVFPLLLGYVMTSIRALFNASRLRWVAPAYLAAYSLLGLIALGYSTWLTFSGDKFGDRFAGGVYRDSYRVAYGIDPAPAPGHAKVDPQIVLLLERYRLDHPTSAPRTVASSTLAETR